jgi:hypothetical protein
MDELQRRLRSEANGHRADSHEANGHRADSHARESYAEVDPRVPSQANHYLTPVTNSLGMYESPDSHGFGYDDDTTASNSYPVGVSGSAGLRGDGADEDIYGVRAHAPRAATNKQGGALDANSDDAAGGAGHNGVTQGRGEAGAAGNGTPRGGSSDPQGVSGGKKGGLVSTPSIRIRGVTAGGSSSDVKGQGPVKLYTP